MQDQTQSAIRLLEALTERAKELTCLYAIEEALREPDAAIDEVFNRIIQAIPPGWQYPEICVATITLEGKEYRSRDFQETPWKLSADILQQDQPVGTISVHYTSQMPEADLGPFLKEERKLIETIADRIDHFLTYKRMKHVFQAWRSGDRDLSENRRGDWEAVLDLIRQTDNALFLRVSNKMLNHLCWSGIEEAEALRRVDDDPDATGNGGRLNRLLEFSTESTEQIFQIASSHLGREEILSRIQMWIQEDKLGALLRTVRGQLPLSDVSSELRRYFFTTREDESHRYPLARGLKVLLIECILSGRLDYINAAKNLVDIEDLYHLLQKVIFSPVSHGKLGGKSAGLFIASQILEKTEGLGPESPFAVPRTWFISADMMLEFIHYNNMDEIIEQKYKDRERVLMEYPHVMEMFRQTVLPRALADGLSAALDDLGDGPLVVRSSSLLADRTGHGFAGKYKTVFLGNQGSREERFRALGAAVAEVYASNFSPEAIEYRAGRGLLELSEQMGVMIQQVAGTRVGRYFLPPFSGVARSRNDLSWLPGLRADDGILRLIPGLGTRAADREGPDHPVLVIPGRAFVPGDGTDPTPRKVDVIDLETNRLETLALGKLLEESGGEYPGAEQVLSPVEKDLVTFDGLVNRSPFIAHIRSLLRAVEDRLGTPVEIEFASDGERIQILQCCMQPPTRTCRPAPIPKDTERDDLLFRARRFIMNGWISNVTHVIYLRPSAWDGIEDPSRRAAVVRAVAMLNDLLPKRQFLFIRPGCWREGANGRSGVPTRHGDFDNAAALLDLLGEEDMEVDVADMGPHLLQDFPGPGIRYVPLFLHDEETSFNEPLLMRAENVLADLAPGLASLDDVIRVIDVPAASNGRVMHVLMNAELGEAVGLLSAPEQDIGSPQESESFEDGPPESYWRWRYRMAEQIAARMDPGAFGVERVYLFGSTKNGTAGPASDIDLLVHFRGDPSQREALVHWLHGWSLCLDEVNYLRTGYRSGGLLDFHVITDEDVEKKTSYAVKINAVTDAARPLKMKERVLDP